VGWVSGGSSKGLLGFVVLVCVGYISVVVVEDAFVRDLMGLGLCKVSIVGCQVGRRGSLVTSWGRMGGEGQGRRRE
jgi:hypothetical protein